MLGAGAWGTALGLVLVERGYEVSLWSHEAEHVVRTQTARENVDFFPGFPFPNALSVTGDLQAAVEGAPFVVVVVPSQAVREVLRKAAEWMLPGALLVLASKGIEQGSHELMTQVAVAEGRKELSERVVVLSGPSFASEVARKVPTNLVAAATNATAATEVQRVFSSEWLRVYTSADPIGVEVGGALKNVIAIAAGAVDGLGLGHNTRAALMTRGIAEMARMAVALGGSQITLAGLSGIGDLILTCTGEASRNRTLGYKLGTGVPLVTALEASRGVAEGYSTAKSAFELSRELGVEMPIIAAVHSVLYGGSSPTLALRSLLSRPLHSEWE